MYLFLISWFEYFILDKYKKMSHLSITLSTWLKLLHPCMSTHWTNTSRIAWDCSCSFEGNTVIISLKYACTSSLEALFRIFPNKVSAKSCKGWAIKNNNVLKLIYFLYKLTQRLGFDSITRIFILKISRWFYRKNGRKLVWNSRFDPFKITVTYHLLECFS